MQVHAQLRFNPSEDSAIHWAARSGLEHALALRKLEELYARALPYIRTWAYALTTKHGWSDEPVELIGEMPVAVCLGRQQPTNEEPLSTPHISRLVLPHHFASFLNPDLTKDWATMFHNLTTPYTTTQQNATDIFQLGRAAGIPRPLQNIIYLLQVLSPGLLLVRYTDEDEDTHPEWDMQATDYGLPPSLWVGLHIEDLEDIFGATAALGLYHAAEDPYCSSETSSVANSEDDFFDSSSVTSSYPDEDMVSDWADDDDYQDQLLDEFDRANIELAGHGKPVAPSEPMLAQPTKFIQIDKEPVDNTMDYRHCDAQCAFCGKCDERFAQQLMQRLVSMAVTA